jgi:lysyl-tRNA synthetase class 2
MANNLLGKAAFLRIQDTSGRLQLYIKHDIVGDQLWQYYKLLDRGDIIGATGRVFKTRTGEVSVEVHNLILLQKSYRPLPEKFHGLHDVETRYRQRYLDLIANEESRAVARIRSQMTWEIRQFLDERGFIEFETPILQPLYGGAAATPFVTHVNALDMTAYLRISDELYLKRLIIGGFERVYEIGKDFRNEGISRKHNPEFTMLEVYQAYADYQDMMRLLEDMVVTVTEAVKGGDTVEFDGHTISFRLPWERLTFHEAMVRHAELDLAARPDVPALLDHAVKHHVVVSPDMSRGKLLDQIWSTLVEPALIKPTLVYDYPVDFPGGTLAKRSATNPEVVERFEAFIGGIEIANAFTELNDPFDQLQRFNMVAAARGADEEAQPPDMDFITALEYGMPPTGGLGVGVDRLAMLLTNSDHIREVILFPLLRSREEG